MNMLVRIGRPLAVVVLAAVPALLALLLVGRLLGADLTAFCPAYDVDQYLYAREAATFAAAGFDGGYYGGDGHTAVVGRFGAHGAAYPILYGSIGKLFGGWSDFLAPAGNMALVTLALLACARAMALGSFAWLAVCLTVFPPLVFYLPLSYQEAPQMALGLGIGVALAALAGAPSKRRLLAVLGLLGFACLTRPTWAVLFPAAFFCASPGRFRDAVKAGLAGGACLVAGYGLFALTAAPWVAVPGTNPVATLLARGPGEAVPLLLGNLRHLADFADNRLHTLTLLLMFAAVGLAVAASGVAEAPGPDPGRRARLWRGLVVHGLNIGVPLATYITIYNGSGRHLPRLLAAQAVASLGYAAASLPRRARGLVFAPLLAGGLALLPATLADYALYVRPAYDDYAGYRERIAAQATAMDPALRLSLDAKSPWLRTLAVVMGDLAVPFLATPPAYGLEIYGRAALETLDAPLRPGFALLDAAAYARVARTTPLTPVADTPYGTLYRNDLAFGLTGAADKTAGGRP